MTHHASKFTTPPPPASFVARPRLEARLDAASTARLTVVSGRAGAGKTALLAHWITTIDASDRAWITLDAGDNTPATFWGDVDATLQQLSRDARAGFNTRREWRDAFLVLDDAHVLTTAEARHNLASLVALIPPWMHLVVACRGQVPISLWRLRTAGELVEIDDADLRLDRDEAAGIVAADGAPSSAALDELHRHTDGWVTGLKLMTSARHSSVDTQDALREFFLDEVFAPQSPELQCFLMETAPLERLTPGLCERVTGRTDAADVLHELERANLFVSRLPGRYGTYQVHAQFRTVLRDELGARHPDAGRTHPRRRRALVPGPRRRRRRGRALARGRQRHRRGAPAPRACARPISTPIATPSSAHCSSASIRRWEPPTCGGSSTTRPRSRRWNRTHRSPRCSIRSTRS